MSGVQHPDPLSLNQLWRRYEGKMKQDWETFGGIQLAIMNLFNSGKGATLNDISPYHHPIHQVRENLICLRMLDKLEP